MNKSLSQKATVVVLLAAVLVFFQNCSENVTFSNLPSKSVAGLDTDTVSRDDDDADDDDVPDLDVCDGVSCDLDPITKKPGVVTVLIALGDEADSQLVVHGGSAQLIAETIVRYASPVKDPRILIVRDRNSSNEDPEDAVYVRDVLLKRYNTVDIDEPVGGLQASDLMGFDLVWFNNPGHSMGSAQSRDTLMAFAGGVILQGDDLTQGSSFSLEALTGLKYIDNGTTVVCGGVSYRHDNNLDHQYRVTLDESKMPGDDPADFTFFYGNDIDNSKIVRDDLEVLAWAQGGPASCTEKRPAIVRYQKE